ncbi:uncharacterized protein LOC34624395 [Cyclospora cayetanensis]|uniref:Uncharacterized protein LOC34624395 n=1 Tax=Cyclospora cayetanensis TaxID=88456 RepID=A0A6P6RZP9_9EIME|nr:uncharacterized protein LOC34624395 [Cyclospora cayetanensis]
MPSWRLQQKLLALYPCRVGAGLNPFAAAASTHSSERRMQPWPRALRRKTLRQKVLLVAAAAQAAAAALAAKRARHPENSLYDANSPWQLREAAKMEASRARQALLEGACRAQEARRARRKKPSHPSLGAVRLVLCAVFCHRRGAAAVTAAVRVSLRSAAVCLQRKSQRSVQTLAAPLPPEPDWLPRASNRSLRRSLLPPAAVAMQTGGEKNMAAPAFLGMKPPTLAGEAYAAAPPPPEAAARLSETLAVERRRAQPPPRKQLKTSAPPESQCSAMAVDGEARGAVHSGAPRACICVLQGPSGSGKRWLLMSLADSLGMRVIEFDEAAAAAASAASAADGSAGIRGSGGRGGLLRGEPLSLGKAYLLFLSQALKRVALPLEALANSEAGSRSSSSSKTRKNCATAVVLLRQLPASLLQHSSTFARQLQQLLQQQQQQQGSAQPLVLRLLQQLQEQTAADLRGEGLAAAAARVAAADVAAIAAASKGDLRQALGSLRLAAVTPAAACLETGEAPAAIAAWLRTTTRRGESRETRAADRSSSAARKKTAATAAAAGILAAAMWCKDAQLASFHVIGKFLYGKRLLTSCTTEQGRKTLQTQPPQTRSADANASAKGALRAAGAACAAATQGGWGGRMQWSPVEREAAAAADLEDLLAAVDEDEQMHEEQRQMDCVYAAAAAAIEAAAAAPLSAAHLHAPATAASRLPLHYRLREDGWLWAAQDSVRGFMPSGVSLLPPPPPSSPCAFSSAAAAADRQQQPRQLSFSMLQRKETRPPLYFVPSAVLQQMTLDPETFVQLLHANYPPFFEDIEDAAAAAAAFATMDAAAAFSVAHRWRRHGGGDAAATADERLAATVAEFCGRAVLDANLHPCCPSRSSSSSSSSEGSTKGWGFAFSGSVTADLRKRQQKAGTAWRAYTTSVRLLLQQQLQQQLRPEMQQQQQQRGPPPLLRGGGPSRGQCSGLCCLTPDCSRALLQWEAPLLHLLSPRVGGPSNKRPMGPPDHTDDGDASSTLGGPPPPGEVLCERCRALAKAPSFPWRGERPFRTSSQGSPLEREMHDIEEIEEV